MCLEIQSYREAERMDEFNEGVLKFIAFMFSVGTLRRKGYRGYGNKK